MEATKHVFRLKIANLLIEVHTLYEQCQLLCEDYILPNDTAEPADIIVDIVPRNIMVENDESQRQEYFEGKERYLYYDPGYLEQFAVHRKICEATPRFSTILMHGAVVAYDGLGYMFTAPSGTGKTTRAKLWCQEFKESIIVNGDKPFLSIDESGVTAFGSPWCGKEQWNKNVGVPLQAIFILERVAEGKHSEIREIKMDEAYNELIRQVYIPRDSVSLIQTLKLLKSMQGKVKIFRFRS